MNNSPPDPLSNIREGGKKAVNITLVVGKKIINEKQRKQSDY